MTKKEMIEAIMSSLAQGVINIAEGHTTIEHESRVHRAMSAVVTLYQQGELTLNPELTSRLSAPGYMDCTDWLGPFNSLGEAQQEIRNWYEVDPDTGEDLDDHEGQV